MGSSLLLFGLLVAHVAVGQEAGARRSERRSDSTELQRAQARRGHDPEAAIRLVKESLAQSLAAGNTSQTAEGYTFLGVLYEDIDQPALALARYREALAMWWMLKWRM